MDWSLFKFDWGAIGALATAVMAFATFVTLKNNKQQFMELQKQNLTMQKQGFESTLFHLLHEVKKILLQVSNTPSGIGPEGVKSGLSALESKYENLQFLGTGKTDENGNELRLSPTRDNIEEYYMNSYESLTNLGSYFRSLYRVIKYIDESTYSKEDKYQYTSFVRAQLTDIELLWLFYNCTVGYGEEKFKPLIEKWTLLKNLPRGRVVDVEHLNWVNKSATDKTN